jgi:hypothetical protein
MDWQSAEMLSRSLGTAGDSAHSWRDVCIVEIPNSLRFQKYR